MPIDGRALEEAKTLGQVATTKNVSMGQLSSCCGGGPSKAGYEPLLLENEVRLELQRGSLADGFQQREAGPYWPLKPRMRALTVGACSGRPPWLLGKQARNQFLFW